MHIPDGFITAQTAVATGAASAGAVGYALAAAKRTLQDRQIPLVGVTAAFVFAVQMLNFPVGVGVSGHLLGGALAAILLGPWMAALVLAVVLFVQAVGFADGGFTALGANISLMSLAAGIGGYVVFRALTAVLPRTRGTFLAATAVTAWVSVVAAAALCSAYLVLRLPDIPAAAIYGAMLGVHALIGVGEATITVAVVGAVIASRPDLVYSADRLPERSRARAPRNRQRTRGFLLVALGVSLFAGVVLSSFADADPDGLETAVLRAVCDGDRACLRSLAGEPVFDAAPLPDYAITPLSGILGVGATFALGAGALLLVRSRRQVT